LIQWSFRGNPKRSYRTREPLKIVGGVTDWVRQTPGELQKWQTIRQNMNYAPITCSKGKLSGLGKGLGQRNLYRDKTNFEEVCYRTMRR
jgi:hypothetical protein